MKVLIFAGYYVPSVKGGGPIQSIKNLVDNLSDDIEFYIVAEDRDLGDSRPFQGIETDKWLQVGRSKVYYVNSSKMTWKKISKIMGSIEYDFLYLNSFFSYKYSMIPFILSVAKGKKKSVVLAPRGQFSPGALGLKSTKKNIFLRVVKKMNLYKNITWHATAESESEDIGQVFGTNIDVKIANNLTANYKQLNYEKNVAKEPGIIKIIFVSRIHPKKNLEQAIIFLKDITGQIEFNIYGPIEDEEYWKSCERLINTLPSNIKISYKGIIKHEHIIGIFKDHHIFLFPTLGENYGHVISEALIGGCPVIISNQTPWRKLEEKKIGWDIDLNNKSGFVEAIQYCVDLNEKSYLLLSKNAFSYAQINSNKQVHLEANLQLFK